MSEREQPSRAEQMLDRISLFAELAPVQREQLLEAAVFKMVKTGDVLVRQGQDLGGILNFIVSGSFQVSKLSPQGKETILRLVTAAESFSLAALIDEGQAPATITATQEGFVMVVTTVAFLEVLRQDFALTMKLVRLLSGRLREAYEQLHLIASSKARTRIARILLFQADRGGVEPLKDGWRLVTPLTYSTLSRIAGISYEETIRILQEWTSLLEYRRGEILLKDLDGLQQLADQD